MVMDMSMIPYLHFTTGDNLLFKSWHPSSSGALAGASIGLLFLAIFERWISAIRGVMEAHWKKQAFAVMVNKETKTSIQEDSCCASKGKDKDVDIVERDIDSLQSNTRLRASPPRSARVIPPFIPSHDLTRGAVFAFQALLQYVLMLAVMTFQAAFFITIVAGLGIGEMLFGRFGSAHVH